MSQGAAEKRYAKALFEVAEKEAVLEDIEKDMQLITEVIHSSTKIENFIYHPQIDGSAKKEVIESTLNDKISLISKNFLFLLIDNNRLEILDGVQKQYVKLANEARGIVKVEAISVAPLNDKEQEKIIKLFSDKLNKKIQLVNTVDSTILGGIVLRIGDKVFDGSISKKLQVMKRNLTTSQV